MCLRTFNGHDSWALINKHWNNQLAPNVAMIRNERQSVTTELINIVAFCCEIHFLLLDLVTSECVNCHPKWLVLASTRCVNSNFNLPLAHISDPIAEPVSIADTVLALWQEAAVLHFRCLPRRFIIIFNVFFCCTFLPGKSISGRDDEKKNGITNYIMSGIYFRKTAVCAHSTDTRAT